MESNGYRYSQEYAGRHSSITRWDAPRDAVNEGKTENAAARPPDGGAEAGEPERDRAACKRELERDAGRAAVTSYPPVTVGRGAGWREGLLEKMRMVVLEMMSSSWSGTRGLRAGWRQDGQ